MVRLTSVFIAAALVNVYFTAVESVGNGSSVIRKKRWLIFPKGSSLQLVYCFLISTYGTKDGIFTVGFTVGLAWEIPVDVRKYVFPQEENKIHDRQRRELFGKIEKFIDKQNGKGKSCVLKAVCESKNLNRTNRLTFMQAIIFEIFILENDDYWQDHEEYFEASHSVNNCAKQYSCPFSFFHKNVP